MYLVESFYVLLGREDTKKYVSRTVTLFERKGYKTVNLIRSNTTSTFIGVLESSKFVFQIKNECDVKEVPR